MVGIMPIKKRQKTFEKVTMGYIRLSSQLGYKGTWIITEYVLINLKF